MGRRGGFFVRDCGFLRDECKTSGIVSTCIRLSRIAPRVRFSFMPIVCSTGGSMLGIDTGRGVSGDSLGDFRNSLRGRLSGITVGYGVLGRTAEGNGGDVRRLGEGATVGRVGRGGGCLGVLVYGVGRGRGRLGCLSRGREGLSVLLSRSVSGLRRRLGGLQRGGRGVV